MDYPRKASVLLGLYLNLNWFCLASAVKVSGDEVINLGHKSALAWEPLMHISANLSFISSITSNFELRTLDPEGIIFYGDTQDGRDWFVLSLRDGIPEVQIGKANMLVSVKGGPKLNDGSWHKLELRSEGKYVVVEINDKVELVVGMESDQMEEVLLGTIRLALGGMLVDQKRLLHSFNPEMDACIRAGNWLNLSASWEAEPHWKASPCFPEIKKGSYFPGSGFALFNTSDLPGVETEEKGVTIEVHGSWHGTPLSLQSPDFQYILTGVKGKESRALTVELKEESGSSSTADSTELTLTLLKHSLVLNGATVLENESIDFLSMWTEGMSLVFGGVQGKATGEAEDSSSVHHLQGCLEKILIQGKDIDLDRAYFKHSSISSHSCPANAVNELTEIPTVIKAFKGQNVTLPCYGDTRHDVKDVKWKKDGQRVLLYTHANRSVTTDEASESRFMMSVESFLGGDLSLHISSVHLSDAGLYQCLLHDESQDGEPRAVLLTVEGLQQLSTTNSSEVSILCALLGFSILVIIGLIIYIQINLHT